jgi:hypothetical protein
MLNELDELRKDVQDYIEVRFDFIRLHAAENLSRIFSNAATIAVAGYLLFLIIIFLSFSAAYFFGSLLDSTELGFLCVAGFYFILLIVFLALRKRLIEKPVVKSVIRLLFPKFDQDETNK